MIIVHVSCSYSTARKLMKTIIFLFWYVFALTYYQLSTPKPWSVTTGPYPSEFHPLFPTSTLYCRNRWQGKPACRETFNRHKIDSH